MGSKISLIGVVQISGSISEAQDGHEVNIYKLSTRADSSNWSINATAEYEASKKQVTDYYQIYEFIENSTSLTDFQQYDFGCWKFEPSWMSNNIHAHESGHLFNWPDEYFAYGGAVNQRYTLATSNPPYQIDLKIAEPADFWKRNSKNNLMGEGTLIKNPQMHEYYLHQIRDWFEKETGINWDVKS